ncbi:PREDICTED: acanthoscurrin-1-like [Trachymyrmex cornetzi]|uniref:acanthoscurrin-1-like n=1 Tax=Trachymyrmex cornetzi TaxID=471704 RepID=UPI00084ED113|nr:PREDICTED: acanthoscurrin-1-like [Trachymyrmex cornetzi]
MGYKILHLLILAFAVVCIQAYQNSDSSEEEDSLNESSSPSPILTRKDERIVMSSDICSKFAVQICDFYKFVQKKICLFLLRNPTCIPGLISLLKEIINKFGDLICCIFKYKIKLLKSCVLWLGGLIGKLENAGGSCGAGGSGGGLGGGSGEGLGGGSGGASGEASGEGSGGTLGGGSGGTLGGSAGGTLGGGAGGALGGGTGGLLGGGTGGLLGGGTGGLLGGTLGGGTGGLLGGGLV